MQMKGLITRGIQAGSVVIASLFVAMSFVHAGWKPVSDFGLGEAGNYAVFLLGKPSADTLGNAKLDLAAAEVNGDVAVGPFSQFDFQGPSTINGDLYLDPTIGQTDILSYAGILNGLRYWNVSLASAVSNAVNASQTNASRPPTQTYSKILGSMTIAGNGETNVINIGSLDYARSSATSPLQLTLQGGANDLFILNVTGKFVLGPNASIKSTDPSRVLINVLPGTTAVSTGSNSYIGGTLLAVSRKMGPMSGISGPVIGAQVKEISLLGGAVLNPQDSNLLPVAVISGNPSVIVGNTVSLSAENSTSPSSSALIYEWSFESKPHNSNAQFAPSNACEQVCFTADQPGEYLIGLVVSDGSQISDPARFKVTAINEGGEADLRLQVTDNPDPVVRKKILTYTMTVENEGPGAVDSIDLKASLIGDMIGSATTNNAGCSVVVGEITCALGGLAADGKHIVTVSAVPKKAGTFSLQGIVTAPGSVDPDLTDNSLAETTKVLQR
jgi:hypothetical protein